MLRSAAASSDPFSRKEISIAETSEILGITKKGG